MPEGDTVYATAHRLTEALGSATWSRASYDTPVSPLLTSPAAPSCEPSLSASTFSSDSTTI